MAPTKSFISKVAEEETNMAFSVSRTIMLFKYNMEVITMGAKLFAISLKSKFIKCGNLFLPISTASQTHFISNHSVEKLWTLQKTNARMRPKSFNGITMEDIIKFGSLNRFESLLTY